MTNIPLKYSLIFLLRLSLYLPLLFLFSLHSCVLLCMWYTQKWLTVNQVDGRYIQTLCRTELYTNTAICWLTTGYPRQRFIRVEELKSIPRCYCFFNFVVHFFFLFTICLIFVSLSLECNLPNANKLHIYLFLFHL
jgi:hypothetical protein